MSAKERLHSIIWMAMRSKRIKTVEWDAEAAEKAGYEHFMIKEIHEQPKAVSDTLNSVVKDGAIDLSEVGLQKKRLKRSARSIL